MTVNTGQQPQPVKHPDRTTNPVTRPLAMHQAFHKLLRLSHSLEKPRAAALKHVKKHAPKEEAFCTG